MNCRQDLFSGKALKTVWLGLRSLICLLLMLFLAIPQALAGISGGETVTGEPVAAGVVFKQFTEGQTVLSVLQVDLTNPYVKLDTLIGSDDRTFSNPGRVLDTAVRTGAVAAINGDFFITREGKHPLGFAVKQGKVLTSPMLRDDFYSFAMTDQQLPIIDLFHFKGVVRAVYSGGQADFPLAGINKPQYSARVDGQEVISDIDSLQMYTPVWGSTSRGAQPGLTGWVEAVVENGVVKELRLDQPGAAIPADGYVLSGFGKGADFLMKCCQPGSQVEAEYQISPLGDDIWTAIGGKDLLVENGQPAMTFSKELEGKFARSALGITRDNKTLYVVAVDGGEGSAGIYLKDLAQFMADRLGVWRALDLDGGGSTSLAVRPLGETAPVLITPTSGVTRAVPTALGIFSTAPAGKLSGLVLRGPAEVLAGLTYGYTVRGYDQYYNPVAVTAGEVSWNLTGVAGSLQNGRFTPAEGGNAVLQVTLQGVSQEFPVRVIGAADLASLRVEPGEIRIDPGQQASLKVEALGKDGRIWMLPEGAVQWQVTGGIGSMQGDTFQAAEEGAAGKLTASFLGLRVDVPVTVGFPLPEDVRGHWAADQIAGLLKQQVLHGYPDGLFKPDRQVSRAEFVTILAGALKLTNTGAISLPFKDQIPDWALPGVQAAWSNHLIRGYEDGTFQPDRQITRAELAVMMAGALKLPVSKTGLSFQDADQVPTWARESMQQMVAAGLMKGSDGLLRPAAPATRAEVAVIIYQALYRK